MSDVSTTGDGAEQDWGVDMLYGSEPSAAPPTEHVTDAAGLDLADIPEAPGTGEADNAGGDDPDEFVIAATDGQQFPLVTASIQLVEPRSDGAVPGLRPGRKVRPRAEYAGGYVSHLHGRR